MRKIARCACAGNSGERFPATNFKGNHQLAAGKMFPAFPAHMQHAILRIWQEAHDLTFSSDGDGGIFSVTQYEIVRDILIDFSSTSSRCMQLHGPDASGSIRRLWYNNNTPFQYEYRLLNIGFTIIRLSYRYHGNPNTGKTEYPYWMGSLATQNSSRIEIIGWYWYNFQTLPPAR